MKQLSQNLKTALQEVGELSALIYLSLLITDENLEGWKAFRNYADEGCDIVIVGHGKQINIEVKTRQTIAVTEHENTCQFTVTEKERYSSQFLIAYWFNKSTFFIVPTEDLRPVKSNGDTLYKFVARYSEQNTDYTVSSRHYAHDWARISEAIVEHG
jgi:hypothetical protein